MRSLTDLWRTHFINVSDSPEKSHSRTSYKNSPYKVEENTFDYSNKYDLNENSRNDTRQFYGDN